MQTAGFCDTILHMKNSQKGSANIILIALIVILAGVFGYVTLVKKSVSVDQQQSSTTEIKQDTTSTTVNTSTSAQIDEIAAWQAHTNNEIGFSLKYPQGWKVEDYLVPPSYKTSGACCLNVFNSATPYQGDKLKQNVMKAQFQYHVDISVSNKQQFIDSLIKRLSKPDEMGAFITIDSSSFTKVQNKNDLDILGFPSAVGSINYVIPTKQDFSEVLYIIVWNPDSTFEKVLSTFKFIPIVK